MDKNEFLQYLHAADFRQLFVNSGWDNPTTTTPYRVSVGEATYSFTEAAQKKGFRVYVCKVEKMPDSSVRRVIDSKLRKASHEYLAVYVGASDFHHLWSVPVKSVDKRQLVTIEYAEDDQAGFLREKLCDISFALEEEPTIIEVISKVNAAFLVNKDDVTKKFYQGFRKQHDQFVKCIEGIDDKQEREWYSSVMLNRLMFCYFVQKKEFLNLDPMYLQHKLVEVQVKRGEDKFYGTFYKRFLRKLFEDGLNSTGRSERFLKEFGRIPYLNGGMFELHALEKKYKDIDIPDKVFESLFAFFDQWRWHLDTHLTGTGRDINPDVLGYIFEQYINDRAEMGAYYTKEDITEYIGRNCIIPYLLGKVLAENTATAKWVWAFLRKSGDRYIFPAMLKGVDLPLPDYIERGVSTEGRDLRARRSRWNEKADESYALPTEIWRETVARRQRCQDIRDRIKSGKITDIHDFITHNLDIRTFVEDLIRATDDHLFVLHFYNALREVTVLDPTCGSGAFLFAALNILEPLYEACLDRMEEFHEKNKNLFKEQLEEIKDKYRSNQKYFVYKNIILRNLYGVDIMHEATEIARLRLFLKMMAVVDVDPYADNLGLDPLPDIDFNIKCGNTLVGYASEKEIWDGLLEGDMFAWEGQKRKISDELDKVALAFKRFRECQLDSSCDREVIVREKKSATECQKSLRDRLDRALASSEYNIDSSSLKGSAAFDKWRKSTQPFHWYSEFYPIMQGNGGFDVIIGNPPYVQNNKVTAYSIEGFHTSSCGNLYALIIERSLCLVHKDGFCSMIVPLSLVGSKRMTKIVGLVRKHCSWLSFYSGDTHPGTLFSGVQQNLSIFISRKCDIPTLWTSDFIRFADGQGERAVVFDAKVAFVKNEASRFGGDVMDWVFKIGNTLENGILEKFLSRNQVKYFANNERSAACSFYHNVAHYWVKAFPVAPYFKRANEAPSISSHYKEVKCLKQDKLLVSGLLTSSLFYFWYILRSNARDLTYDDVISFYIDIHGISGNKELLIQLEEAIRKLQISICKSKQRVVYSKKSGNVTYDQYWISPSKSYIDAVDELLSVHYGFTEEELDFIINYDIKYRMGDELNEKGE